MLVAPINHLVHALGITNTKVAFRPNGKHRAKDARKFLVRRKLHLELRHLHVEDVLVFADLGEEGVAGGTVEI